MMVKTAAAAATATPTATATATPTPTATATATTFFQQSITALQFVLLMDMANVLQTTENLKVIFI
jgi:hypothetical protein